MECCSASDRRESGVFHEHGCSIFKSSRLNSLNFRMRREVMFLIYCSFPEGCLRPVVAYDLLKSHRVLDHLKSFRSLNPIFMKMQYGMLTVVLVDEIQIIILPEI